MDPIKTAAKVKRYLDTNKKKIGLEHVKFSVSVSALPDESEFASITLLDGSWANLNLSPIWIGLDPEAQQSVICHELAHLFLWDFQAFAESATKVAFSAAGGQDAGASSLQSQALFAFGAEQYDAVSERTTERVGALINKILPPIKLA